MQVEIASAPARAKPRFSWETAARLTLPATILANLVFELALAERKYALFGGGFGQSQTLDTALEIGAFLGARYPCGQPALEVGQEVFARRTAGHTGGTQFDSRTYLRGFEAIGVKRPGSAPTE